jgi:hypothetical protein
MFKKNILIVLFILSKNACATSNSDTLKLGNVYHEPMHNIKHYDWSTTLSLPKVVSEFHNGYQILHFDTSNYPIEEDLSSYEYAKKNMSNAKIFDSDSEIIQRATYWAEKREGIIIKFGVYSGHKVNFLAALNPKKIIYAFDTLKGIGEDWRPNFPKGTFSYINKNQLPMVLPNVNLITGSYDETTKLFVKNLKKSMKLSFTDVEDKNVLDEKKGVFSIFYVDTKTYINTKVIFKNLGEYINKGTIIVLNEYFNYPGWQNHEFKAFQEFVSERNLDYEYLAYNRFHSQVIVRIK